MSDQLLAPAASPLGKVSPSEPQSRSERFGEEKGLHLPRIEPHFLSCPARSVVTVLTDLFRLSVWECRNKINSLKLFDTAYRRTNAYVTLSIGSILELGFVNCGLLGNISS